MDKQVLIEARFAAGLKVLRALDRSGLSISVALWLYSAEHEHWRFVLASPQLDTAELSKAYGLVHHPFEAAGISTEQPPALMIMPMSSPFIRALRRIFAEAKSIEGMRFGDQFLGDRFVPDALVYRVR